MSVISKIWRAYVRASLRRQNRRGIPRGGTKSSAAALPLRFRGGIKLQRSLSDNPSLPHQMRAHGIIAMNQPSFLDKFIYLLYSDGGVTVGGTARFKVHHASTPENVKVVAKSPRNRHG